MDELNQPPDPWPPPQEPAPENLNPPMSAVPETPAAPASPFYVPSQDERTFATLAHALQMPGWWIAPLIILLTKKDSKFVKFHAAQVLLLQALHVAVIVTVMVIFFAVMFGSIASAANSGTAKPEPPAALFAFLPLMWFAMFGMYVLILVLTIMYSIKAGKGEWANYPVLGQLARYMCNL
jgi:uncharacterized membrane protein